MARWRARGQREVREWKDSARAHLNECSCSEKCTILSSCLGYGPAVRGGVPVVDSLLRAVDKWCRRDDAASQRR